MSISKSTTVIVLVTQKFKKAKAWIDRHYSDAFFLPRPERPGRSQLFDGCEGQSCIVLDNPQYHFRQKDLMKVLDKYPLQVEVVRSYITLNPSVKIVVCDQHPNVWYPHRLGCLEYESFMRRITQIIDLS